jgi:uncharacterized protein
VHKAKLNNSDKQQAIKSLTAMAQRAEKDFIEEDHLDKWIEKERQDSWKYDGRTVFGKSRPKKNIQLNLFD